MFNNKKRQAVVFNKCAVDARKEKKVVFVSVIILCVLLLVSGEMSYTDAIDAHNRKCERATVVHDENLICNGE